MNVLPSATTAIAAPAALLAILGLDGGDWFRVALTVLFAYVLVKIGLRILGSFAQPVPAPPDPGELRKVRLVYRCSICATEVRMTMANDEVPEPPRHCQEDMDLVTPVDDL